MAAFCSPSAFVSGLWESLHHHMQLTLGACLQGLTLLVGKPGQPQGGPSPPRLCGARSSGGCDAHLGLSAVSDLSPFLADLPVSASSAPRFRGPLSSHLLSAQCRPGVSLYKPARVSGSLCGIQWAGPDCFVLACGSHLRCRQQRMSWGPRT